MEIQYRNELNKLIEHFALPKVVAEVGVAEGWFTKEIVKWDLDKLYLIDAWEQLPQTGDGGFPQEWHDKNYGAMVARITGYFDKIAVLRGLSVEMAKEIPDNSLGLVYIDCCHEYECVKKDLEAYLPKVVEGGIVSGHDFLNMSYGVNQAVKEFCEGRFELHTIPDEDESMAGFWFRKTSIY